MNKDSSEAVWLVKSGERILGPFTTDEVNHKLLSKEFVLIDEVISPRSRWRYFRDESAFAATVEEIRRVQMSSREDTEVQGHTSTQTATDTDVTPSNTETTVVGVRNRGTNVDDDFVGARSAIRDAEFIDVPGGVRGGGPSGGSFSGSRVSNDGNSNSSRSGSGADEAKEIRRYGFGQDAKVQLNIVRQSRAIWMIALAVVVTLAAFAARLLESRSGGTSAEMDFNLYLNRAKRAWELGDFENALKSYKEAEQLKPGQPFVDVRLAPLLMRYEGQTVAAKRLLQDTLNRELDPALKEEAWLGLGLAAIFGEDLTGARLLFEEVVKANPSSIIAHFNLGMVAHLSKSHLEAIEHFRLAAREGAAEPAAHLMIVKSYLAMEGSARVEALRSAEIAVRAFLERFSDFRQETQILGVMVNLENGNLKSAMERAEAAFDADPELTDEHFHDPLLYLEPLAWNRLLPVCQRIREHVKAPVSNALLAICLVKAGDKAKAGQWLADLLGPQPEDPMYQTANAYLLMKSGREEDARGALKLATRNDESSHLALILTGRNCTILQDKACAREAWAKLTRMQPLSLVALAESARLLMDEGRTGEASTLVRLSLSQSSRYLPSLRLRNVTESGSRSFE